MADSNITCSALATFSGLNQILVAWNFDDPNAFGLTALQLKNFELWSSSTVNFSGAGLVGSPQSSTFVDVGGSAGLSDGEARYYWVRAVTKGGLNGEFYPPTSSAGISGETRSSISTELRASTIIGSTIETAESGARIEVDAESNRIRIYDSSGAVIATMGDEASINADAVISAHSSRLNGVAGYFLSDGGLGASSIFAISSSGYAVYAQGGSNAPAVYGFCTSTGPGGTFENLNGHNACVGNAPFGGFAFYAAAGGYGPFTGGHEGFLDKDAALEVGDVVCDISILARRDISNTVALVGPSDRRLDQRAVGVLVSRRAVTDYDPPVHWPGFPQDRIQDLEYVTFNAVGEGQVNVCGEGGVIDAGDLLCTSSIPGKLMKQPDDIVRSYTVARARECADLGADETGMISCIYLCG
jgi:hypothetical protein